MTQERHMWHEYAPASFKTKTKNTMRINKTIAEQIAIKLTENKKKLMDKAAQDYSDLVLSEYLKQTPKEVIDMQKKQPDYFSTTTYIKLDGHGFNWEQVKVSKVVIANGNNASLKLNAKIASSLSTVKSNALKVKSEYNALKGEIQNALCNLRTFAQIQAHLPEAVQYLPKSTSVAIVPNYADLRKKIK